MNKQKKIYIKLGIVFEDFRTGELHGTPEMIEKIKAAQSEKQAFQFRDMGISCAVRSGN